MTTVIVILAALALLAGAAFIILRNSIVGERNRCEEAWSGIDVQLRRRHDLVPKLIEAVKGYASHEQQLFASTAESRAPAMRAEGPG